MTPPLWLMVRLARRALYVAALWAVASPARAQSADNILLVINSNSPESAQVGDYYARKRSIGPERILRLPMEAAEQITRPVFESQIERPVEGWFAAQGLHDRILYIVLAKGVPLRIAGTGGRAGTVASVDSELALLYRRLTGRAVPPQGSVPNPYFLADRPIKSAARFTHEAFDIFLVTRLDGYTVADVVALIDRGMAPARNGKIALDEKASLVNDAGNRWLERSADLLRGMGWGDRVILEATGQVLSNQRELLGYYSWGSNDPVMRNRDQKLEFVPGALAGTFVSTDGRTFKEPPASWTHGTWEDAKTYFAGSPQSLTGDLIRQGVTGVSGHVAEPYLDATVRPDVLFPAYLSGFNLAEAFYLAMPFVGWQTVVIGDPLVAPFRQDSLSTQDIDRGPDPATELPAFFSGRILQVVAPLPANRETGRLLLLAQTRLAKGNAAGGREALEAATRLDGKLMQAHLLLGTMYEQEGQYDQAIERYRRVIAIAPTNVTALNNLAYLLAVRHTDALEEATTLAQRANTLVPRNPSILDTLAWILHLGHDDRRALATITPAIRLAPNDPQLNLHAAVIHAANGMPDEAARELAHALELDPSLEKTADVQQLRTRLGSPKP